MLDLCIQETRKRTSGSSSGICGEKYDFDDQVGLVLSIDYRILSKEHHRLINTAFQDRGQLFFCHFY